MPDPAIDVSRTRVVGPDGTVFPSARFVYRAGTAAVWVENNRTRVATRVLFSQNAQVTRPPTARQPIRVQSGEEEWLIRRGGGGGG